MIDQPLSSEANTKRNNQKNNNRGTMIAILGTTATGKTELAYELARRIPSEIISYDSRHVYKGMTIGTGKDLPDNATFLTKPLPHFRVPALDTSIWLMDTVDPDKEWSVAQFVRDANQVVQVANERNTMPILVGGTMFYLQQFLDPSESLEVKQNKALRASLAELTVGQLQARLQEADPDRLEKMNNSDRNNPARLVRAIEVASAMATAKTQPSHTASLVCIDLPFEIIQERITTRVKRRFAEGMIEEVQQLIDQYPDWSSPAFSALGYREIREYIEGKISKEEAIERWVIAETQYAKRQVAWLKKLDLEYTIEWLRPTQEELREENQSRLSKNLANRVKSWYDSTHDKD